MFTQMITAVKKCTWSGLCIFLSNFAFAEGKLGGEFYTPTCIVRTLVEMLELFEGQIFDPVCGSGGMFCQSTRFVRKHQDNVRDISICGQESIILQKNLSLKSARVVS